VTALCFTAGFFEALEGRFSTSISESDEIEMTDGSLICFLATQLSSAKMMHETILTIFCFFYQGSSRVGRRTWVSHEYDYGRWQNSQS
jgi:hypothetical protein